MPRGLGSLPTRAHRCFTQLDSLWRQRTRHMTPCARALICGGMCEGDWRERCRRGRHRWKTAEIRHRAVAVFIVVGACSMWQARGIASSPPNRRHLVFLQRNAHSFFARSHPRASLASGPRWISRDSVCSLQYMAACRVKYSHVSIGSMHR